MRGVAVESGGHIGHSCVGILDLDVAHPIDNLFGHLLAYDSRSSTLNSRRNVVVTIALRTSYCEEAVALLDLA